MWVFFRFRLIRPNPRMWNWKLFNVGVDVENWFKTDEIVSWIFFVYLFKFIFYFIFFFLLSPNAYITCQLRQSEKCKLIFLKHETHPSIRKFESISYLFFDGKVYQICIISRFQCVHCVCLHSPVSTNSLVYVLIYLSYIQFSFDECL